MLLPLRDQIQPVYRSNLLSGTFLPTGSTFTAGSLAWYHDATGTLVARPHNLLLNSATVSTQTVTSVVGAIYTVSFYGTGSIEISGAYTGTLNGTGVNDRVSVQFTATTTSIVLTVSGTVTNGQVNRGALQPYYPTTSAAYYGPRFAYDPATLQPIGLQLEQVAGTNLLTRSSQLANWTNNAADSATDNVYTSPEGLQNAGQIVTSSSSRGRYLDVATSTGTNYAVSGYIKSFSGSSSIRVGIEKAEGTTDAFLRIDTTTGAVIASSAAAYDIYSVLLPNGWTYFKYRITTGAAQTNVNYIAYSFGSGSTFSVWGAQVEAGTFASSPIPTYGSAVTRTAEALSVSAPWLNSAQGSFVVTAKLDIAKGASRVFASLNDGSASNRYLLKTDGSDPALLRAIYTSGSFNTVNSMTEGIVQKVALSYSSTGVATCANGGAIATGVAGTGVGLNKVIFGANEAGTETNNMFLQSFSYYNYRISNAQMQQVTT